MKFFNQLPLQRGRSGSVDVVDPAPELVPYGGCSGLVRLTSTRCCWSSSSSTRAERCTIGDVDIVMRGFVLVEGKAVNQ